MKLLKDLRSFNPRTYIRYDLSFFKVPLRTLWFQSTYLYKVRLDRWKKRTKRDMFQSTYLYKVRLCKAYLLGFPVKFQSTYLYKVRQVLVWILPFSQSFNPRTYIRYDGSYPRNDQSPMWFQSTYLYKVRR